jgi:catechol 2,3-dioxygenase-like lactoylglutathione lyase family enzyme
VKLRFIHAPVTALTPALDFYRDTLGLSEAWREGTNTVAFKLPGSGVQVMVTVKEPADEPPGPMYQVPDLDRFLVEHPDLVVSVPQREIPDGHVIGVADPAGNVVYFFDQVAD